GVVAVAVVAGLGAARRRILGLDAAAAIGTGRSSSGGAATIGRLSVGGVAKATGARLCGNTTALAFFCRKHPLNSSDTAAHNVAASSLRNLSPYTFKRSPCLQA